MAKGPGAPASSLRCPRLGRWKPYGSRGSTLERSVPQQTAPTEDGHPTGLFSECPAPRQGLGAMGAQGVKAGIETPCPLLLAHLVQAGALAPHPTHPHSRPARHRGGLSHPRGQRSSDGWSQLPRARQQMGSTATLTHRPFGSKARLPISKPEPPADPLLGGRRKQRGGDRKGMES